jgi:hypothetical protein
MVESAEFYVDPESTMTRFLYYNPRPAYFGWGKYMDVPYEVVGAGDTHFVVGTNSPMSKDVIDVLDCLPLDDRTWGATLFKEWSMREYGLFSIDKTNNVVYSFEPVRRGTRFTITNSMGPMTTTFSLNAGGYRYTINALALCHSCRFVFERYAELFIGELNSDFDAITG